MQEATPIVDEDLLEAVTLGAKSCGAIAQLSVGKDIDIKRKVTSPPTVGDITASLHESPTTSQYSIEGQTSLEVATRRLSTVDSLITIPGVTGAQLVCTIAPPTTYFCLGAYTHYFFFPEHYCDYDTSDGYLAALKYGGQDPGGTHDIQEDRAALW